MKLLKFCSLILFLAVTLFAQKEFRLSNGVKWGMSPEQVNQLETGDLFKSIDNCDMYIDKTSGTRILYDFINGKLAEVTFLIKSEDPKLSDVYNTIRTSLYEKFGQSSFTDYNNPYTDFKWEVKELKTNVFLRRPGYGETSIKLIFEMMTE